MQVGTSFCPRRLCPKNHVAHGLHVIERDLHQLEHAPYCITMTTQTPGILEITSKMAERHTISVVGLLKDVEFHIAKGAAEVFLDV